MSGAARRERVAERAAREIFPGARVNLGIGLPTLIPRFLPPGIGASFHSENGFLGMGPEAAAGARDPDLIDAGGRYVTLDPGGAFFDSATSFALVRTGRLDLSFLGAFEVDVHGNLANWRVPGRITPGIGGSMELAQRVPRLVVASLHTSGAGAPKLVERCTLPLTTAGRVARVVTELAVLEPAAPAFRVLELAPGVTEEELRSATAAPLDLSAVAPWGASAPRGA